MFSLGNKKISFNHPHNCLLSGALSTSAWNSMPHLQFLHHFSIFPLSIQEAVSCENLWYFMLLTLSMHIPLLDDVSCKHLTSGNVLLKRPFQFLVCFSVYIMSQLLVNYPWLTCAIKQIWIFIYPGSHHCELIFRDLPSNNVLISEEELFLK